MTGLFCVCYILGWVQKPKWAWPKQESVSLLQSWGSPGHGHTGYSHALGHWFCSQTEVELRGAQMARLAKIAL